MKKLFLCSSFEDVAAMFVEFAACDLAGKTVTFIPTAAQHEAVNFYVEAGKTALEKMGLTVDVLEVSAAKPVEIADKLQKNDFIYVSGGNTFFLLQELKRTGADTLIMEQVEKGKVYMGESAGSMIMAPNIAYAKEMDDAKAAPSLENFDALHAVAFYPLPHYTCFPYEKEVETILSNFKTTLDLKPITNAQAILVNGDDVTIQG